MKAALVPVIELPPFNYEENFGLKNIIPVEPLSWLYELENLPESNLRIILTQFFEDAKKDFESINEILEAPIEYAPLIAGGFLFMIDDRIISEPGCCCGIESITEWEDEFKEKTLIWTGHDKNLVYIQSQGSQFQITIDEQRFLLKKDLYLEILEGAKQIVETFIQRSGKLLDEILNIQNGESIARAMIYKWG